MNRRRIIVVVFFFLFIISSLPLRAEASGSGDYPPPADGDWDVYNDTFVENETIVLNGNLTVYDGASLTFRNVTLIMNSSEGGTTIEEFYHIEVKRGGTMRILDQDEDNSTMDDSSNITIKNTNAYYWFWVRNGSDFIMRNSELHHCGGGPVSQGAGGLTFYTDNSTIEKNLISDNEYGVVCWNSDAMISNNTIRDNAVAGVLATVWSNGTIENNRFVDNSDYGVWVDGWSNSNPRPSFPDVTNNYIENSYVGIQINIYSIPNVRNNTIVASREDGIYCGQWCEVTIRNTTIDGGNFGIVGGGASRNVTIINSSISNTNYYDLSVNAQSYFTTINTTFSTRKCDDDPANLTVKWYLHTKVEDQLGDPVSGATVMVRNATGVEKYNRLTDSNGWVKWMVVTEYVDQNVSGSTIRTYHTPHEVEVSYSGLTFSNNPRSVDVDTSKTEIFVANESIPEFPVLIVPVLFVILINISCYIRSSK